MISPLVVHHIYFTSRYSRSSFHTFSPASFASSSFSFIWGQDGRGLTPDSRPYTMLVLLKRGWHLMRGFPGSKSLPSVGKWISVWGNPYSTAALPAKTQAFYRPSSSIRSSPSWYVVMLISLVLISLLNKKMPEFFQRSNGWVPYEITVIVGVFYWKTDMMLTAVLLYPSGLYYFWASIFCFSTPNYLYWDMGIRQPPPMDQFHPWRTPLMQRLCLHSILPFIQHVSSLSTANSAAVIELHSPQIIWRRCIHLVKILVNACWLFKAGHKGNVNNRRSKI